MYKKLGMLLTIPLLLTSTACARSTTETAPRTVSEYCLIAKPITYSKNKLGQVDDDSNRFDTAPTIEQIIDHDLVYEKLCNKTPNTLERPDPMKKNMPH